MLHTKNFVYYTKPKPELAEFPWRNLSKLIDRWLHLSFVENGRFPSRRPVMLNIIVQYYNDSNPERQAEVDDAFRRNLECPWVTQLHNLVEPETDVPDWLAAHPKYAERRLEGRLTYLDAIEYGNESLKGERICLMNADTFVEESPWFDVRDVDPKIILCQTRHELLSSGELVMDPCLQKKLGS